MNCSTFSILLLILLATNINADCNVCSGISNVACVSKTQFQTCIGNIPSGPINSCPTGYICTAEAIICQVNTATAPISCTGCNQCDATNTFACTGPRTYALCLGTGLISNLTGSCSTNYVCNINYQQICGSPTMGIQATCSFYGDGTGTGNIFDPAAYCQNKRQTGRFPYGQNLTTSCKQYIYCYLLSGTWSGVLLTCAGSTYFDTVSGLCTTTVPSRCSNGLTNQILT